MNFFGLLSDRSFPLSKLAVLYNDELFDYSSLFEKILSTVSYLLSKGINKNDKVVLLGNSNPHFIFTIFALWKLNAIPIPINNKLLKHEIEKQVLFSGCKFLIYDSDYKELIKNINIESINFSGIKYLSFSNTETFSLEIKDEQTALILFTSGSTGNAKAVIFSFKNLISSAEIGNQVFDHNEKDVWLAALPFFHIGGFSIITRSFLYGTTLAIPNSIDINGLKQALHKYNPSLSSFVTTQLKRLLDSNINPNPSMRHILLGGGFIEPGLIKRAYGKGWNVSKSFGTTETSSFVSALSKDDFFYKPDSAGKALYPNKISIVDENRNILSANASGEIVIESDAVTEGYLNNTEETNKKFSKNIFYTGDYGYLDKEGFLFVEARRNDLIVSGGENIYPYEVEKEILKHPDIKDVSVFGSEDKEWGHAVSAAIVTTNNKNISLDELKFFLKDKLPSFKHPHKIYILKKLPRTPLGKIQKDKLKEIINKRN